MTLKSNESIFKDLNCPPYVTEHSHAVLLKAEELASNLKTPVDMELVKKGALFHDIGRCKTNGIKHAVVGADILKTRGCSCKLVNIVERHIGAGITCKEAEAVGLPAHDYIPLTIEEKLVAHADNLIHGTRKVGIDFVVRKWENKLGKDHPSIPRLIKLHHELTGELFHR